MNLNQVNNLFDTIPDKFKKILQVRSLSKNVSVICLKPGAFKIDYQLNNDLYRCILSQNIHNHFTSFNTSISVKTSMRLQYNGVRAVCYYIGTDTPEWLLNRAQKRSNTNDTTIVMLDSNT